MIAATILFIAVAILIIAAAILIMRRPFQVDHVVIDFIKLFIVQSV